MCKKFANSNFEERMILGKRKIKEKKLSTTSILADAVHNDDESVLEFFKKADEFNKNSNKD